jgi:dipeptidase E
MKNEIYHLPIIMKLLLTSAGISNTSIHNALVDLLGKPIAECNVLFIPTAIYPFPRGAGMAWQAICGKASSPLAQLGWKSLGVLELANWWGKTALLASALDSRWAIC